MTPKFSPGDRIEVKASKVLGTPAVWATVLEVHENHLVVHCDGDAPEWFGPVSFKGEILQN